MSVLKRVLAALVACVGLACGGQAQALSVLGGKLYATGTSVTVEILQGDAAYESKIYARNFIGSGSGLIGTNHDDVGEDRTFTYAEDDEVKLRIKVTNTDKTYYTGPGSRNDDDEIHALVDYLAGNIALVYFEDLWNLGDEDYNDIILRVTGVDNGVNAPPPPPPPPAIPEPATYGMFAAGLALLGAMARRRTRS